MLIYFVLIIVIVVSRIIFKQKYFLTNANVGVEINKKNKFTVNAFIFVSFLVLFFISGFRGINVGIDTPTYIEWFEEFNRIGWERTFSTKKDVEFGWLLINYWVSKISHNPQLLIIVVSFLILSLHFMFLKKTSKNIFISIILFLSFNHFFTSMCSLRQFIAMGIVFFVYPMLIEKKYIKVFILMAIAFFFHYSTLIFDIGILLAFLFSKKKRWIWIFLLFSFFSVPVFVKLFNLLISGIPKYSYYMLSRTANSVGKLRTVYIIIEICLIVYVLMNKKLKSREMNIECILITFSITIGLLGAKIPLMFRLGYYFEYFLLLLVPELIVASTKKITLEFYTVYFSFLFYAYYLYENSAGMCPWYSFIL